MYAFVSHFLYLVLPSPLLLLTSCLSTSASLNPDLFVEILNILFTFVFRPEQYLDCGSVLASFMCANCVFSIAFDWMAHTAVSVCVCRLFVFIFYLLINSNGQRDKQKNNSVIAVKSGHRADHHERKSRCVNEWMNGQEKTHEHNSLSGDARDFGENWWEPCGRMEWHANIHEIKYIWISEINSFGWIIIVFNRTGAPQIHFTHSRSI